MLVPTDRTANHGEDFHPDVDVVLQCGSRRRSTVNGARRLVGSAQLPDSFAVSYTYQKSVLKDSGIMWSDADSGHGSSLRKNLHVMMSTQNHVSAYQQQGLNLSEGFKSDGFSQSLKRPRSLLDSQSHRVIEKRRRDRMNNCLADLGQLVADAADATGVKHTGQGRIKKTEIIEMAIDRIRALQAQIRVNQRRDEDRLLTGFKECRDVAIRYLVDQHGHDAVGPLCSGLLVHLHEHLHSICHVGSIASQSTGSLGDRDPSSASLMASVTNSATSLSYGLPSITSAASDDHIWKSTDQIYVKPEALTPDTAAMIDDDLAAVVGGDLSEASGIQPKLRVSERAPRRISEATGGQSVKSDSSGVVVVTSDDGSDERCWNGAASNDDDEDDDGGSPPRRRFPHPQQHQQRHQQRQINGAYKYKDSIKRRFCSESDARSWNESASDCSSSVGIGCSSVELRGRGAGTEEGGEGPSSDVAGITSRPCAVASAPTSPEDPALLESSTALTETQTLAAAGASTASKLEIRRSGCCSCSPSSASSPVNQTPGFVLHQTGAYYVPVFVSMRRRRTSSAAANEPVSGSLSVIADSDDCGYDDDDLDDDVDEEDTSSSSRRPMKVTCHPISIPVNLSCGSVSVICGCVAKPAGEGHRRRRVTSEPAPAPAPMTVTGGITIGSSGRHFPSAPTLLQRL